MIYYMVKLIIFFVFMSLSYFSYANFKICMDRSSWKPFTYVNGDGIPSGIQIEVISQALFNLKIKYKIIAKPWKRCLLEAKSGKIDAIATASYKKERAAFLYYPIDAITQNKSDWRVMQVEYSIISLKSDNYHFDGEMSSIPQPVYVPLGYSIASFLKKNKLQVDSTARGDINNFKKLAHKQKGSVVAATQVSKFFLKKLNLADDLVISEQPIRSKSYFLAVSKKSLFSESRQVIWDEIKKVREENLQSYIVNWDSREQE